MPGLALVSIGSITDRLLSLPGAVVLAVVFALPALEASAFVGFVFPGETVVILGGVVASQGKVPLWTVFVAAASGAIIGDSLGYFIGRRWGAHLLHGTIGRLPIIRGHLDRHLESAQAYVRRRQGSAVFFGRFTAALRVLVPGLAGMSDVHYPTFLAYNVAGGVLWGGAFAILGYLAGASYKHLEKIAGQVGLALLALIVVGLVLSQLLRRAAEGSRRLATYGDRLAATPQLAWVRSRFPGQVRLILRRLDPADPRGFWLTLTLAFGALAGWAFAGLTQDVVGHDETVLFDPRAMAWVVAHRTGWLTSAAQILTWLGSTLVIVPLLLLVATAMIAWRGNWRGAALPIVAVAGAVALHSVVGWIVGHPRPPASLSIGHYAGPSFPSGHATAATACYGMLAVVLSAGRRSRVGVTTWIGAGLVILLVGASRIYLGAHWLTDVLGGYALGGTWIAVVLAVSLLNSARTGHGENLGRRRAA
jgi:membrane protein DedA with SNARE-associated domain/membrane-associated phospholipid phosphatase